MKKRFLFIPLWFKTWRQRQPWKDALALLMLLACAGMAFMLYSWNAYSVRVRYTRAAGMALNAKDYPTARVACDRLLSLENVDRNATLFQLALAAQGLGQNQEAAALFAKLAPLNEPVYAPAHLYVAKALISGTNNSPQATQTILTQLQHVLKLTPNSPEANEILGRYYFQQRKWALVINHLKPLVSQYPAMYFPLIAAATELKDPAAANWKEQACAYYENALKSAKGDSVPTRLQYVQTLVLLEQFPKAVSVMAEGFKFSSDEAYRSPLGDVYAAWAENLTKKEPQNLAGRIDLIKQGLEMTPRNPKLLGLLLAICRLQGAEAQSAHELVTKMLSEGRSSGMLHFIAGSDAWEHGDVELAKKHYSIAFDLAPEMPAVANNMAMILTLGDHPDLPRALSIIQSVADKLPDDPFIRDTRGAILVKMDRPQEAIKDLEFALPLLESKGPTHEYLAKAYAALGMKELAEQHKKQALPPPSTPKKP